MTGNKKMVGTSKQEINQEEEVVRSIKTMFDNVPPLLPEYSIYRVPERLRNVNVEAYTPMVVSIGPYHHGKEKYKTMEYHKLRYLYSYLIRDYSMPLHHCVKLVLGLEKFAREFYAEAIFFTKEEFVKMMLVDGFFIVELIRQYHNPRLRNEFDPIFKNHWIFNAVHRDMLLLESQLPFSVLESLFTLINDSDQRFRTDGPFLDLAYGFLDHYKPTQQRRGNSVGRHLLHLSQQGFISPMQPIPRNNDEAGVKFQSYRAFIIPSATELHEAGIKFQSKEEPKRNLLVVEFIKGVLYIPPLVVDDRTESLFRNLVALEQQSHSSCFINDQRENSVNRAIGNGNQRNGGTTPVTDYVTLMDCLINTSADVALLRDHGIIHNWLGDNEEVAQLFNKLRSGITAGSTEFYFYDLFLKVNEFYKTPWHAWKAKLKRDYFNTPWASLSFVAAVFLLICTFVQALFSILQVVKN
ncbi:hypothetical protein FRX31_030888 [Thalictrum thalictroides]|uniref:Uncharacterized protein n=1 Tax=Thalictrum thalictroides TaxID=46969 RepID=A0A7J6V3L9_THATH|nr:hypothetical protein FRX31_030888 [Thalictrum thalictroides]